MGWGGTWTQHDCVLTPGGDEDTEGQPRRQKTALERGASEGTRTSKAAIKMQTQFERPRSSQNQ